MPSTSKKQQHFMGAQLNQQRKTGHNSTGMSEGQLSDFAHMGTKTSKKKMDKGGRSIIDVEDFKRAPEVKVLHGSSKPHPIHAGYDHCVPGTDMTKFQDGAASTPGNTSALRDIGNGIHMGAPVDFYGPDTDFRTEEINIQHYGRDYNSYPRRDYFKDNKKESRQNLRIPEQLEYDETATPGTVADDGLNSSLAYGSISFERVPVDIEDHRGFKEQRRYAPTTDGIEDDD